MSLKELLFTQLKDAMKNKNVLLKNVITMLRSDIKNLEIEKKQELSESEILDVIGKQIKMKHKAMADFQSGSREDLVEETKKEIEILLAYLPKQLDDQELEKEVEKILSETEATSIKDMGKVMSIAKSRLSHRVDMQKLSAAIKEKLK